jgi:hypothetical protein
LQDADDDVGWRLAASAFQVELALKVWLIDSMVWWEWRIQRASEVNPSGACITARVNFGVIPARGSPRREAGWSSIPM